MHVLLRTLFWVIPLCLVSGPALAASLSGTAFGAGYGVPLFLLTHLLGLLVLGLWAAEQGGAEAGRLPVVALAAGALFAAMHLLGLRIPHTGLVLEGTLVVLGGLVLVGTALPAALAIVLAVIAGAAQGVHLGAAGRGGDLAIWPGLATGALLALGAGVGLQAVLHGMGSALLVRAMGGAVALVGVLMLLNII